LRALDAARRRGATAGALHFISFRQRSTFAAQARHRQLPHTADTRANNPFALSIVDALPRIAQQIPTSRHPNKNCIR